MQLISCLFIITPKCTKNGRAAIPCMLQSVVGYSSLIASRSDASATQNPGSCSATEFERYCLEQNGGRLPFGVAQVLPAGLS